MSFRLSSVSQFTKISDPYEITGIKNKNVLASCMRMAKGVEAITAHKFLSIPYTLL